MTRLINYNSYEAKILKPIFELYNIDSSIVHIVENFIYKDVKIYNRNEIMIENYMSRFGIHDGLVEQWYSPDLKRSVCFYKQGKKEGLYESWYKNGAKWMISNYKDGKLHGIDKQWHYFRKLFRTGIIYLYCDYHYKEGKLDGICKKWYPDGQIMHQISYKDGKNDGLVEEWYSNGQKQVESFYKEGKLDGICKKWNENGQLVEEQSYKDGIILLN